MAKDADDSSPADEAVIDMNDEHAKYRKFQEKWQGTHPAPPKVITDSEALFTLGFYQTLVNERKLEQVSESADYNEGSKLAHTVEFARSGGQGKADKYKPAKDLALQEWRQNGSGFRGKADFARIMRLRISNELGIQVTERTIQDWVKQDEPS